MAKTYAHELNKEVHSISGYYVLQREERIAHRGKEILYVIGHGVVEASCCGIGGCSYAIVPGVILNWKSGANEAGLPTSVVEPVEDTALKQELQALITQKEGVSQVQFW
jgi:hypothetical protein